MPGDIREKARSQSGFQACHISQRKEGDLWGGEWSFEVNAHRILSIRLRDLGFILWAMRN